MNVLFEKDDNGKQYDIIQYYSAIEKEDRRKGDYLFYKEIQKIPCGKNNHATIHFSLPDENITRQLPSQEDSNCLIILDDFGIESFNKNISEIFR